MISAKSISSRVFSSTSLPSKLFGRRLGLPPIRQHSAWAHRLVPSHRQDVTAAPQLPYEQGWDRHSKSLRSFSASADIQKMINTTISSNKVTVFSKTYCPFCTRTKQLFRKLGEDAHVIELDELADGGRIQRELAVLTGQRSVPNVFVNGQHLGGNDDTQAAHRSGKLQKLLDDN